MRLSSYERMKQSERDFAKHRQSQVEAKFSAAGLTWDCGRYPMNGSETASYNAGFQRACRDAWRAACDGQPVNMGDYWEFLDGTAAGAGLYAGWDAAAKALSE